MYVEHDLDHTGHGYLLYFCRKCNGYFDPQYVKVCGYRYTKRTRRGRKKVPRMAHQAHEVWFF